MGLRKAIKKGKNMPQIEKIATINNPAFKTGVGKNGKAWTMMQVTTDKNNLTTVFAPASVGDTLELTWNEKYGNWSAQKLSDGKVKAKNEQMQALRQIYKLQLELYKVVTGADYIPSDNKPAPKRPVRTQDGIVQASNDPQYENDLEPDYLPTDDEDFEKPIKLDDIPF